MNKKFLKSVFVIALPVAIQNFISTLTNLIDTFMISGVSENAIAAVGLANQVFFLLVLIIFGIGSGSGVFISQFYGDKDYENIKKSVALLMLVSSSVGFISFIVSYFFSNEILSLLISDKEVILLGSKYLKTVSFSFFIFSVSFSFTMSLRSVTMTKLPMLATIVAVVTNTILNYYFIYVIKTGVSGAAIATVIGRIAELIILFVYVYYNRLFIAVKISDFKKLTKKFIKKVIKVSLPVVFTETFWSTAMVFFIIILGKISASSVTAFQVTRNIYALVDIWIFSLAYSSQVMIGILIGEKKEQEAIDTAKLFIKYTLTLGLVIGLILALSTNTAVSFFNLSDETKELTKKMLYVFAFMSLFKSYTLLYTVGISRAGADTRFTMLLEIAGIWFIGIPLALFATFILKVEAYVVFMFFSIEEIVKAIIGYRRFKSGKWINSVIKDVE